jgi:hypothetical protein
MLTFTEAIQEVEKPSIDIDAIEKYLHQHAPEIAALLRKDLTVGDVHQSTALGNERDRRRKPTFKDKLSLIAETNKPMAGLEQDADRVSLRDEWSMPFHIIKSEPEQQQIFGWASVAEMNGQLVVDKQDDIILPEDLEKAAYDFVLYCRSQGDMHEQKDVGRLIESMMFTKQKQEILGIDLGMQGWWVGFKVDNADVWKSIKAGNRPEFSIGGRGHRVDI